MIHDDRCALKISAQALFDALQNVNKLVGEAAITGFNCSDGDWAERLFTSQAVTHRTLKAAKCNCASAALPSRFWSVHTATAALRSYEASRWTMFWVRHFGKIEKIEEENKRITLSTYRGQSYLINFENM